MKRIYLFFRRISAVLIGMTLFLGGFLKIMDPVGTGLIVGEYYNFLHIPDILPANAAGTALSLLECIAGAALMTGVWRRITAIASGILLFFFTVITTILYIFNPAMDCGCFGEFIHLTHAQSLVKNLILCVLWLLAFIPLRAVGDTKKIKYATFCIAVISIAAFCVYSYRNLPLTDFTPLSAGTELNESDMPLYFNDASGNYCDSIASTGKVLVISSYDPGELETAEVLPFISEARNAGFRTIMLSSGGFIPDEDSYSADRRLLMTLNRSNGGVTFIDDGEIISKWPSSRLPDAEELEEVAEGDSNSLMMKYISSGKLKAQGFLLYVFAVMLLL